MRILLGLAAGVFLMMSPAMVVAHPLGNFTINQYSRVVIGADAIEIRYVVDMAEIPAFQERLIIDADGDGVISDAEITTYLEAATPELIAAIELRLDGELAELTLGSSDMTFPDGQGGLSTLRMTLDLEADLPSTTGTATYRVDAYPDRLGWREIIVQAGDGISVVNSSVPATDVSEELQAYPADSLESPLAVREATFSFQPGPGAPSSSEDRLPGAAPSDDLLVSLLRGNQSLLPAVLAIGVSMVLGAAHAVSPGHGKTLVAAYLIGSDGSLRQAMWLGVVVAATHTIGILVLGGATLIASEYFVPDRVIGWLGVVAGATIILLGTGLLLQQVIGRGSNHAHGHGHDHGHEHLQGHDHPSAARPLTPRRLIGLGLVGGLVPSASALLVLLLAITLDRVAFGLALIVAFGIGMAIVLGAISASVVVIRDRARRMPSRWMRAPWVARAGRSLPVLSAIAVLVIGLVVTIRAVSALAWQAG